MLKVSLFSGPNYLIENEGTVSAHVFNAIDGIIPESGLVISVDAPNLSEFDLEGISVEGGEIVALRDAGFDLRMTEYTTLVNLPIADDGETETEETATFSLAVGDGYEIISDYSSGTFNLVDTRDDIPQGTTTEPNNTIPTAVDTQITPENPSFSGSDSIYFDIGNRYLNPDGTYTYIDYSEDVNLYKVDLSAGDTIAIETFEVEGNPNAFGFGLDTNLMVFDAQGNQARDYAVAGETAAPDKLFGSIDPFDENKTDTYSEFTALEDGTYYVAIGSYSNVLEFPNNQEFNQPVYDPLVPGTGNGDAPFFGNYGIEIDLITEDNPRKTGTPTPPVSNPGVTEPPTLSLTANPATTNSDGNFINAVVEHVEPGGLSNTTFTIQAEGEIPEGGIEFILNSNGDLFDYVSIFQSNSLPSTIGGQSLGAFYNEDGIPTGIRLRIEESTMTVTLTTADNQSWFPDYYGNIVDEYETLETDGAEDVTFFLQPGEGYEVDSNAGTAEVTYYDSVDDVPPPTAVGGTIPEVGVTVSETNLIETEGTETTLTFTLSEAPPEEGIIVYLDSEQDPLVGSALSQFDVLDAEIEGGNFPVPNGDTSGFFFTITEQTATITLSVFDELTVSNEPFAVQEGILDLNFALQPQAGYTIDPDASEINFTILDNPDSKIQVILTGEPETLIESEGTVSIHTFNVSAALPEEGLTVSVSAPSLSEFDLDAIDVTGGTIAEVRDDGFDLTITKQTATISLPVLDDGVSEGSETATFTLEPGDIYEVNQEATEATFILADTLDEVSVPEEIEGNDTLAEANALGLATNNPSVSLIGKIDDIFSYYDPSEDVDFFSFNLEAGQTVSLDIDSSEWNTLETIGYPVVFPALDDVQNPDTELRLFDAQGNELAANNDGAAPGEDFSRDPYLEYTAETAGTYYVGVSQLGNRDYDPNVARSGSGWIFPEIGVFYGPYELTATLTDGTVNPLVEPAVEPVFGSIDGDIIEVSGSNQLIFAGDMNDLIDASTGEGNNRIYAGSGDDTLVLGGLDRVFGGAGDDKFFTTDRGDNILTGGAGADQFWIATASIPESANIITDFTSGEDVLGIAGLGIGFDNLSISQQDDKTLIAVNNSELAILQGIGADSLIMDNFAFG